MKAKSVVETEFVIFSLLYLNVSSTHMVSIKKYENRCFLSSRSKTKYSALLCASNKYVSILKLIWYIVLYTVLIK